MSKIESYEGFMSRVVGNGVPFNLKQTKLHSAYPSGSEWFQRCVNALFQIEVDYVQYLVKQMAEENIEGAFAEFGIFQGDWIRRLYDITDAVGLEKCEIWGFDSFQGLSVPHPKFDTSFWKEGMYAASREQVEANLCTAERPRIKLVEGFFSESLSKEEAQSLEKIAFARIDCDIYEPAKECLEYLSSRLANGAVLVFDDWTHDITIGEGLAFAEWVPTVPHLRFEFLCLGPWDHLYVRVWHK